MRLLIIGGAQQIPRGEKGAFWNTLEEFHKHWDRIDILCTHIPSKEVCRENLCVFENVHFHICPKGLLYYMGWVYSKGKDLLRMHHHDVVTIHEFPPFYAGVAGARLANALHIPYAIEIHGIPNIISSASCIDSIGGVMSSFYLPRSAKRATGIRVINSGLKKWLVGRGVDSEKVNILPSFYWDRSVWHSDTSSHKKYDVCFAARLDRNKGLAELLVALKNTSGVSLVVIGNGPDRQRCEALVRKLGIADRVDFRGWVKEAKDIADIIHSSKIFVMNSRYEGGPRSALEAMACGVPVLTTKTGVMTDIVRDGENGVFSDGSSADISTKIHTMLASKDLLRAMGDNAANSVQQFDRVKLIQDYADFLKKLV